MPFQARPALERYRTGGTGPQKKSLFCLSFRSLFCFSFVHDGDVFADVFRIDKGGGAARAGVGAAARVLGIGVALQQPPPRETLPAVGARVTLLARKTFAALFFFY
jgi:hypothetical protein